jgi:hypothetical protein
MYEVLGVNLLIVVIVVIVEVFQVILVGLVVEDLSCAVVNCTGDGLK